MKINSIIFTIAGLILVAIASYYVGVSGRTKHTVVKSDSGVSLQHKEQSVTSNVVENSLTSPVISQQTETTPSPDSHCVVTGILFSEESPSAVINGNIIGEGKSVNGVKVIKIHQDYVEFENANHRWSQKVTKPASANNVKSPVPQVNVMLSSTPTLPSSSQNAFEDFDLRYKLYKDIAKTEYDNEIANAEKKPLLVQKAQQRYTLSVAKIETWHRRVENAFSIINRDSRISEEQRQLDKDRVLNTIEEPMYGPKRIELSSDEPK
jgi:hypothetical protein